jgi:hypothetical protein
VERGDGDADPEMERMIDCRSGDRDPVMSFNDEKIGDCSSAIASVIEIVDIKTVVVSGRMNGKQSLQMRGGRPQAYLPTARYESAGNCE